MGSAPAPLTRLWQHRAGRVLAHLFVLGWILVTLGLLVRGVLPDRVPGHGSFPWGMFKDPNHKTKRLVVTGILDDGREVEIDPGRYFHYARGFTDLRFYDHHVALRKDRGWAKREVRRFALLLAEAAKEQDGIDAVALRLEWERVHLLSHKKQRKRVHDVIVVDKRRYRRIRNLAERQERRRTFEHKSPIPLRTPALSKPGPGPLAPQRAPGAR